MVLKPRAYRICVMVEKSAEVVGREPAVSRVSAKLVLASNPLHTIPRICKQQCQVRHRMRMILMRMSWVRPQHCWALRTTTVLR